VGRFTGWLKGVIEWPGGNARSRRIAL